MEFRFPTFFVVLTSCCFTFLVLLYSRWWARHLHGQAVGSAEGMTVPYDEGARLPVLQQADG